MVAVAGTVVSLGLSVAGALVPVGLTAEAVGIKDAGFPQATRQIAPRIKADSCLRRECKNHLQVMLFSIFRTGWALPAEGKFILIDFRLAPHLSRV